MENPTTQSTPAVPPSPTIVPGLTPALELVRKSWAQYQEKPQAYLQSALVFPLIALLPVLVIQGILSAQYNVPISGNTMQFSGDVGNLAAIIPLSIIYGLLSAYAGILSFVTVVRTAKGEPVADVATSFREANKYVLPLIVIGLMMAAIIIGGLILLIIPGIILAVSYSFAYYSHVIDGYRGYDALKRSQELTKGYRLAIVWRGIVVGIFIWLVMIVVGIFVAFLPNGTTSALIGSIISTVAQYAIMPFSILASLIMYGELKTIKGASSPAANTTYVK